jgi:hypothetical protein
MKHVVFLSMLATLAACATEKPDPVEADAVEATLVGTLSADDTDAFGTWDGQVYLIRHGGMEMDEPGEWAPYAVGEVYGEPITFPLGGGLPGLPEGCIDAATLSFPEYVLSDVGPTLPLVIGAHTFELEREEWDGGVDYWRDFINDLECDCEAGTTVSFPDVAGEVEVPDPVVLADDFADQWATWLETGTLELRWTPGAGETRLTVYVGYQDGVSRTCFLDDDGAALLELPVGDEADMNFFVDRGASRAVVHPSYGMLQLSVNDILFPKPDAR